MKNSTIIKLVIHIIIAITYWGFIIPPLVSSKNDMLTIMGFIGMILYPLFYIIKINNNKL